MGVSKRRTLNSGAKDATVKVTFDVGGHVRWSLR
jgi:hypothetical protein